MSEKPVIKLVLADDEIAELKQKVHILNEANMKLENAIGSQADYFQQQISVLESKLSDANEVIKNMKLCMDDKYDYDCVAEDVDIYLERYGVK